MRLANVPMFLFCAAILLAGEPDRALAPGDGLLLAVARAAGAPSENSSAPGNAEQLSPEQLMARRYPQPIKVGNLVGLPVLDWEDSTIGFVSQVVRMPEGKVQLIVPYSRWLGWARFASSPFWGKRLVSVPLEKVAILGRQVAALEMLRKDFDEAPTWDASLGAPIPPDETIKIAITRR